MNTRDPIPHLINGVECQSSTGDVRENVNPWTRTASGVVARGSDVEAYAAVEAARVAFDRGPWPRMSYVERAAVLHRLADLMDAHADELAEADVVDMGRPVDAVRAIDVPRAAANFRFYADHARLTTAESYPGDDSHHAYTRYEPAGVVAAITPWNHPAMLGTWKIAAPLAWGNTVVHKPAEDTPTSALLVGSLALEAGLPPGVLNVVQGTGPEVGSPLTSMPEVDRITFTGATATGRAIAGAAAASLTPVSLELGGKGASVVFADADLDLAVDWCQRAIFNNSGQVCLATSRMFVQRPVFDDFVARLATVADRLRLGDPMEAGTQLGPLASEKQFDKVKGYLDLAADEGAELVTGGPGEGWSVRPTVLTGLDHTSRICQEEIFGPVAVVLPFDQDQDAVGLANDTSFGLTATVFTRDLSRAHRTANSLRAGTVWVNCFQVRDLRAPLGGPGNSGIGREGGVFSRDFFTEPKAVVLAV